MVNSYYQNAPTNFTMQTDSNNIQTMPKKKKAGFLPYTLAGLAVGAGTGAIIGANTNPYIKKSGEAIENFATDVFNKVIENGDEATKKIHKQSKEILNKINKIKTPEELKNLLENNKDFTNNMCNELKQTTDEYLKMITKENFKSNKSTITERINGINKNKLQALKNQIEACWDKNNKKFTKSSNVKQNVFDAIQESCKNFKNKFIAKYAIIGGLVTAITTFIIYQSIKIEKEMKLKK